MIYGNREEAENAYESAPSFREWQVGKAVAVYCDPSDPRKAVLKKGADGLAWGVLLLGTCLVVLAGREGWKLRRRQAATS